MEALRQSPHLANAAHMWEYLDELAKTDPEEYKRFLKKQIDANKPPEVKPPKPGFCVRLREVQRKQPFFINVCGHDRVQHPRSTSDGSIPLAVGVPRMCQEDGSAATVTDVVVNPDVIGRANHDAGYREELAALATQCVKDVLTEQKLLPHELLPGHLVLAESKKMYAGTPCAFSDVRGRPSRGSDDGDARGVEAMLAANFGGKACPSSLFEQLSSISPFGSEAGMSAFGAAGGAASHGQRSQDDGEVEPSLKIPNDSTLLGAKSADGAAGPARALIEEIASVEALVEEPKYEWVSSGDDGSNLQLRIYLPRVKAGADVDVHASEDAVHLVAEGLYELKLALPVPVLGDGTRCRFLKKSKTMLLTMPTANGVQARS